MGQKESLKENKIVYKIQQKLKYKNLWIGIFPFYLP